MKELVVDKEKRDRRTNIYRERYKNKKDNRERKVQT